MGNWIHNHRNLLLIALLTLTMTVSYLSNQHQAAAPTVAIPVVETTAVPFSPIEQFQQQRDTAALEDMSALQTLVNQPELDAQTRADAAAQLQRIVDHRQKESALEGALLQSGLYPCAAVVNEGSVTIVTEKATLSDGETALLLTMAELHAGVLPSGVRVVTSDQPSAE